MMNNNVRIFVNSLFIYIRLIVVSIVSFLAVRYLLNRLGEIDFGLYNLIGGVVVLFSFLAASMAQSSQRFISLSMGKKDERELGKRFKSSIYLHLILAVIVSLIIQVGGVLLLKYFLEVPADKHGDALFVLWTVTVGTFFTIIRVPYDAILMSYENILFVSALQTAYAVFRLIGILFLYVFINRLYAYAILMALLSLLYYVIEAIYVKYRYRNIKPIGRWKEIKKETRSMSKFTGVYVVGAFATTFRDQGLPMVLNSFYGVIINASTAIATQVNGIISQFSSTIGTAIRPQLIKSVGAKDYNRFSVLSYASCKYPSLCVILLSVPLIVAMGYVQKIWLSDIPEYAVKFSQIILLGAFIQQLTLGLTAGIDASGNIKVLYFSTAFFKILTLPLAWLMLKYNYSPIWAYLLLVGSEILSALIRIIQAVRIGVISQKEFILTIIVPNLTIYLILFLIDSILWKLLPKEMGYFLVFLGINTILFLFLCCFIGLSKGERLIALNRCKLIKDKIIKK